MNLFFFSTLFVAGAALAIPAARHPPQCTSVSGSVGPGGPSSALSGTPLGGCISLINETCAPEGRFLKLKNGSADTSLTWSSRAMELKDQVLDPEATSFEMIPHRDPKSRDPVDIVVTFCW